jgi:hypothetical protein
MTWLEEHEKLFWIEWNTQIQEEYDKYINWLKVKYSERVQN